MPPNPPPGGLTLVALPGADPLGVLTLPYVYGLSGLRLLQGSDVVVVAVEGEMVFISSISAFCLFRSPPFNSPFQKEGE
jgi:hypothetical protein